MTRRTSDSRSRHKSTKESSLGNRGTRGRHLNHHDQQQPDQQGQLNATHSNPHDDAKAASLQPHPANCECWKLHPGLFLPESLLPPSNNPSHINDDGSFQHYPNTWVHEDEHRNEKA